MCIIRFQASLYYQFVCFSSVWVGELILYFYRINKLMNITFSKTPLCASRFLGPLVQFPPHRTYVLSSLPSEIYTAERGWYLLMDMSFDANAPTGLTNVAFVPVHPLDLEKIVFFLPSFSRCSLDLLVILESLWETVTFKGWTSLATISDAYQNNLLISVYFHLRISQQIQCWPNKRNAWNCRNLYSTPFHWHNTSFVCTAV